MQYFSKQMFMYYCGQKSSKFGEIWSQTAANVLRSRENNVENKNFLVGASPQTPLTTRSGFAARGTCLRHVEGDHFECYIIFRFFISYSVSCLAVDNSRAPHCRRAPRGCCCSGGRSLRSCTLSFGLRTTRP